MNQPTACPLIRSPLSLRSTAGRSLYVTISLRHHRPGLYKILRCFSLSPIAD
jgi:hypothetical protein